MNHFTVTEAWNKRTILSCIKNIALALSDIKPSTLSACWKTIWPEVVVPGNMVPTTEVRLTAIINLLNKFQEGSDNQNTNDINKSLVDHELTDNELIHLIPESKPANEYSSDLEPVSFTAEYIKKLFDWPQNWKLQFQILIQTSDKQKDFFKCCCEY